jgi:tetratricopeptide (TPR) repeat protein
MLTFRSDLATVLGDAGRADEAESLMREVIETAEATLPDGSAFTAFMRARYGSYLMRWQRFVEAEEQLLAAHTALQANLGPYPLRTRRTLEALVQLYESWGKPQKALEYRTLLDASTADKGQTRASQPAVAPTDTDRD